MRLINVPFAQGSSVKASTRYKIEKKLYFPFTKGGTLNRGYRLGSPSSPYFRR